ncbi:MAG: hypothetical protein P8L83_00125 [Flavobacteriaceae bacterium]|nr:hypothetical protein [Flavobacteriaceae bacterium]
MNLKDFTLLLKEFNPNLSKSNDDLEKIIKIYPYFQTAYFLHVKTLQHQEKINFDTVLEKAAIRTFDRSLLMNWVNDKYEVRTQKSKNQKKKLEKPKIVSNDHKESLTNTSKNKKPEIMEVESKKLSFTEWISISQNKSFNNIEFSKNTNDWNIIDSFLNNDPKISQIEKSTPKSMIDLASENIFSDEELMTETLAKIFIKQEKYDKALQAFKILSLKYPEKNALFALQISQIKSLINKNS